jgi:hypothetical protein
MSESRPFAIEAGSKAGSRRNPCPARARPFQALAAQLVFTINRTAFGLVRRADIPSDRRRLPWRLSARTPISCTSNGALPRWRAGAEISYCALHDKIVGYCTVFGTVVGIGPAITDYFGQVDWKYLRSGAADRAGPGRADRRLPRDHLDTAGQPQGVTCSGFSPA